MGQKPRDVRTGPTLQLPSLFRRRKRASGTRRANPDETAGQPAAEPESEPLLADEPDPEPQPTPDRPNAQRGGSRRAKKPPREKKPRRRRVIPGALAAIIAGVVVGGFGTGSTYGALRGCEAMNGTSSCGGPGIFGLLAIVVLMGAVGALLLKVMRVGDPGSTSFLGVGLLCVVVLVALMEELFSVWMFVAIPLLSAICYALARWVTTRFVQPYEKEPGPDVR